MLKLFTALEKEMAQKAFIIHTYELVKKYKPITTIYFKLTMEENSLLAKKQRSLVNTSIFDIILLFATKNVIKYCLSNNSFFLFQIIRTALCTKILIPIWYKLAFFVAKF